MKAASQPHTEEERALRKELMALKHRSKKALNALDAACDSLQKLESQMEVFLTDYYDQVGAYVEELERLEDELNKVKQQHPTTSTVIESLVQQVHDTVLRREFSKEMEQEMKSLYRSMAKEYHPDMAAGKAAIAQMKRDVFQTIQEAYARRNIGELWRLKWELEQRNALDETEPEHRVNKLQAHCSKMQQALEEVETRRAMLERSPACALMRRALHYQLSGRDFIEIVLSNIQQRIADKRRELVNVKIKTLYVNQLTPTSVEALA